MDIFKSMSPLLGFTIKIHYTWPILKISNMRLNTTLRILLIFYMNFNFK